MSTCYNSWAFNNKLECLALSPRRFTPSISQCFHTGSAHRDKCRMVHLDTVLKCQVTLENSEQPYFSPFSEDVPQQMDKRSLHFLLSPFRSDRTVSVDVGQLLRQDGRLLAMPWACLSLWVHEHVHVPIYTHVCSQSYSMSPYLSPSMVTTSSLMPVIVLEEPSLRKVLLLVPWFLVTVV